jgi:hypothetical protein
MADGPHEPPPSASGQPHPGRSLRSALGEIAETLVVWVTLWPGEASLAGWAGELGSP